MPHHTHAGEEHILTLAGSQSDERGDYPAGTATVNRVGSSHSIASPEGCLLAILWEKPVVFSVRGENTNLTMPSRFGLCEKACGITSEKRH